MNTLDTYGELELPDETAKIEVVEDPVKTVISCYEMFKKLSYKNIYGDIDESMEKLYQIAIKVFEGKEKLNPKPKELKNILKFLLSQYHFVSENAVEEAHYSFFLSGLQNMTRINTFILDAVNHPGYSNFIGYKLKENKCLIIENSGIERREMGLVGIDANGIIINNVNVKIETFSHNCKEGVYINNGEVEMLGSGNIEVLVLNNGFASYFGCSENSILINNGFVSSLNGDEQSIAINNDISEDCGEKTIDLILDTLKGKKLFHLKQKLDLKLYEIDFLKALHLLPYEEQIEHLNKFDFNKFKKEVKELAYEIREQYEALIK